MYWCVINYTDVANQCIDWGRYRKFKNPKVLYILETILGLSIICCNGVNGCKKYLKKKN